MKDKTGYTDRDSIIRVALVALMLALIAGCQSDQIKPFLDNLHTDCKRDYTFSLSSGGVGGVGGSGTVTGNVHCEPAAKDAPAVVAPTGQ